MLSVDFIVNSVFDSITWLLSDTESNRVWLVDCGDFSLLEEKIGGRQVKSVLLTHAHFDHIYGLPQLLIQYPDCRIYTNEIGRDTLASDKLNMSKYHECPVVVAGPQVCVCSDGDGILLFENIVAKVVETPGHHPSCLTFVVGDYLFTGDAYIPGVKVVTKLPGGDRALAANSVEKILRLAEGKTICPGHGEMRNIYERIFHSEKQ